MTKVKQVKFNVEFEGHGIVNYDSKEQNYLWYLESNKNGNENKFKSNNNNNMYAKKSYSSDENDILNYKIKVSSGCVRNAIFKCDSIAINPSIAHHKVLLNSFIGSPLAIIRGYLESEVESIKRKSALTITSAVQTNNAVSNMEFCSRSGAKVSKKESGSADNTIFNKETIGDITYEAKGFINIQELEFICADPIFDRCSFNSDDFEILKVFLSKNLPNFDSELGYYNLKTSYVDQAEYGIKLNNENIIFLIKETLKRILSVTVLRSGAYFKTKSLSIELVNDPFNSKNNIIIDINNYEDIDNLDFDIQEYYELSDESETKSNRTMIEERVKVEAERKRQEKINKTKGKTKKND